MKKSVEQVKHEIKAINISPAYAVVPLEDVNVLLDYINRLESEMNQQVESAA